MALLAGSKERRAANRDLTNHAPVNRATFYRYYRDKFDLVDQFAQDGYELADPSGQETVPPAAKHRQTQN